MKDWITDYEMWKLQLPLGRVIGDWTCHYEVLDVLALCLKTNQARCGWGFADTVSTGVFRNPAPWIVPMCSLAEIRRDFEQVLWGSIEGRSPFSLKMQQPQVFQGRSCLPSAIRTALWDLMAKTVQTPLYEFLGAPLNHRRVRAYASGLDFPLDDEEARALFNRFVRRGFTAVKVKVGRSDAALDLQRLRLVRECVGDAVEIAADANEAWSCDQAIQRIQFFQKNGVRLAYVEDPLPRTDIDGFARLNATVDVDIVGHDYLPEPEGLRRFAEHKAFNRLRVTGDLDHARACADISTDFEIPLIFGNSLFEMAVHPAVALRRVDRLEFSDLAWNLLPQEPIEFDDGYAIAPDRPGHGLDPNPEMLRRFSKEEASGFDPVFGERSPVSGG